MITFANTSITYSLVELADRLLKNGAHKVLPTARRVRVVFNQATIVDTTKAVWVWEHEWYPQFYVPSSEIKDSTLIDSQSVKSEGIAKTAAIVKLTVPAKAGVPEKTTDRVLRFDNDPSLGDLAGLVRLEFGAMGKINFNSFKAISFVIRMLTA
jgi:hypothetical protein